MQYLQQQASQSIFALEILECFTEFKTVGVLLHKPWSSPISYANKTRSTENAQREGSRRASSGTYFRLLLDGHCISYTNEHQRGHKIHQIW